MNPLDLLLRNFPAPAGIGMACRQTAPGQDTCFYDASPKEQQVQQVIARGRAKLRESLSAAAEDAAALRLLLQPLLHRQQGLRDNYELCSAMREVLRNRAHYVDDRPGLDTIQSVRGTLVRGRGDCLSFTIALSAMASVLFGDAGKWILAGWPEDPSRHIWPVIRGIAVDAADPMPAVGRAHTHFTVLREVSPW